MSTATLERGQRNSCSSCGNPPRPNRTLCQDCADKRRAMVRADRAAGICIKTGCYSLAVAGQTRCKECRDKRNAYNKRKRQERISNNLCAECGGEKDSATKLCGRCKNRYLEIAHNKNFDKNRNAVLDRDRHLCQLCKSSASLIVHHINAVKTDNDINNLATLCRRCHTDIHRLGHNNRITAQELILHPGNREVQSRQKLAGWKPIRKAVLERDRSRCGICKDKQVKMIIHHKDDRGLTSAAPNNKMDNLVTLCQACHSAITNQRNNTSRQLAARYVLALGAGTTGAPDGWHHPSASAASAPE